MQPNEMDQLFLRTAANFYYDSLSRYNITSVEIMKEASALVARSLFDLRKTEPTDDMCYRFTMRWYDLYAAWGGEFSDLHNVMSPVMDVLNVYAELNQGDAKQTIDKVAYHILASLTMPTTPLRTFNCIPRPSERHALAALLFAMRHCNPSTLSVIMSMTNIRTKFFASHGSAVMTAVADMCQVQGFLEAMAVFYPGANSRVTRGGTVMHVVCATLSEERLEQAMGCLFKMGVMPHILDDDSRSPRDILKARFPETKSKAINDLQAKLAECEEKGRQEWKYATAIRAGWKKGLPNDVTRRIASGLYVAQRAVASEGAAAVWER